MTYDIYYGQLYTRIDVHGPDGLERTLYVHRSEYRTWDA